MADAFDSKLYAPKVLRDNCRSALDIQGFSEKGHRAFLGYTASNSLKYSRIFSNALLSRRCAVRLYAAGVSRITRQGDSVKSRKFLRVLQI